jgi:hypothetical protein
MCKLIYIGIICHDSDVRLVNGSVRHEGRIEVCFNETWGTICDYIGFWGWNITQGNVVCQQLGYSGAGILGFFSCIIFIMLHTIICNRQINFWLWKRQFTCTCKICTLSRI